MNSVSPSVRSQNQYYRADIDGLRALAVLAVIVYHAFPLSLRGGFVGVDIFFVISGFLITGILHRDFKKSGSIHYISFISRRIRRIIPALSITIATFLVLGWFLLLGQEFTDLIKQIIAGSFFSANILFWSQSGYFNSASELKPLLHLWSLGIEEQYYLIWPFLMIFILKRKYNIFYFSVTLLILSFIFSVWQSQHDKVSAFYLLTSRFWELLAGGCLALISESQRRIILRKIFNLSRRLPFITQSLPSSSESIDKLWEQAFLNVVSFASLIFMLLGISLTKQSQFPGFWPLLPVLGAVGFIFAGRNAVVNRLFARPSIVFVGLISYPLYLWHWPIISFEYILAGERPSNSTIIAGLAIATVFSVLTHKLVERRAHEMSMRTLVLTFLAPLVLLSVACGIFLASPRLISSQNANQTTTNSGDLGHDAFHQYADDHYFPCPTEDLQNNSERWASHIRCHQSKNDRPPDVALFGDSHAEQLFFGLAEQLTDRNVIYLIHGGFPFLGKKVSEYTLQYLLGSSSIKTVVINGFWSDYVVSKDVSNFEKMLEDTVVAIQRTGKRVILMSDNHAFSYDPSICMNQRLLTKRTTPCKERNESWVLKNSMAVKALEKISEKHSIMLVRIDDYLKEGDVYLMAKDGHLLYRDRNHLNINGSRFIGNILDSRKVLSEF